MIHIQNLQHDLENGLYAKNKCIVNKKYVGIGSQEVITQRDRCKVKCFPETVVNDYVPFYFSVRTPMLYNIHTGHGVPPLPQRNIIYLCCKLADVATDQFTWCYTNGNAAKAITKFYSSLKDIDIRVDWRSINTTDFRDDNADGDEDRVRKKHAEFLVRNFVPVKYVKAIVVFDQAVKTEVEKIVKTAELDIKIAVNPNNKYYF